MHENLYCLRISYSKYAYKNTNLEMKNYVMVNHPVYPTARQTFRRPPSTLPVVYNMYNPNEM